MIQVISPSERGRIQAEADRRCGLDHLREREPWDWGVRADAFRAGYTVEWLKWEKSVG